MEFFQGQAAAPGVAIAAAARLRMEYGVPTLDTQRLRRLGERLRRFGVEAPEPEQVVLVAEALPPGFLAAPLPGLQFVGVATQSNVASAEAPPCPCVGGLPDTLFSSVEEDEIVIVDGDRGRVYLSPDAPTLARYQAPARLSRRVFIGSAHLPARTASDDRVVSVIARATTLQAVTDAVDAGADGLWVPGDNDFLGPEQTFQTAAEQAVALRSLMDAAGGKPVFLGVPTERLALAALSRAAASGFLTLVLDDDTLREELADRFHEVEASLEAQDLLFGSVRFEAGLTTADDAPLPDDISSYMGVWVMEPISVAPMERLLLLAGLAHRAHKPLTLRLPDDVWEAALAEALELAAERVAVPLAVVADAKDAIRAS